MLFRSDWITYQTGPIQTADDPYGSPCPYFRHRFSLSGTISKATLYVSALGVYKLYLNGKPLTEEYLSPGWVDYRKKLPFVRYDVTQQLQSDNAIGVILGDGWAVGHLGSNYSFKRCGYSSIPEFTAYLKVEFEDGRCEEIKTDGTWRASKGEILRSDLYMGEYVDHRLDLGNFSAPDYDDSQWDYAEVPVFKFTRNLYLDEMPIPPIVVKHTFTPTLVSQTENVLLYDVSQNIAGVVRCVFRGERGAKIILRHGELLSEGKLYTENLRKAECTDTYVLSGEGEETFRPLFTFHGFRYFTVEIIGNAEILALTAEAMYSDLPSTGDFVCSDEITSKLYQNALWSQRDNFLNIPTDCPQRDERLGWAGDAQIFCQSAMYNMDCRAFFAKYLADLRDAQLGNGLVTAIAPAPPVGTYAYQGREAAGWSEAIAEISCCHYKMYGDKKIIRDNLFATKRLLDHYELESPDYIRVDEGMYGDWLNLDAPTDLVVLATLYYARLAKLATKMCHILGDFEEERYAQLYENIKQAFIKKFISDGKIFSDTQTAYFLAYNFGIISADMAKENLVRKFRESNQKLNTGFLAIKYALSTLCRLGMQDLAYKLITDRDYPGWGFSIVNGATTIWEHWDSFTYEHGIRKGMNSFNHYSFGSCTEWMFEYCLGIQPDEEHPGCRKVNFNPYMDRTGKINFAKGHYDTDFGRIDVSWERSGNVYHYCVQLPADIAFAFHFPNMQILEQAHTDTCHTFKLTY